MVELNEKNFESDYFEVKKICSGVFALIEKANSNAGSNAGIIHLGEEVIVFDTFLNISAAEDLKRACLYFTGKLPTLIVNSHSHSDHVVGNAQFPGSTKIISSRAAREKIMFFREAFYKDRSSYPAILEEAKKKLSEAKDRVEIGDLKNEILFIENLAKEGVDIRIPDLTLEGELKIYSGDKYLSLMSYTIGHSEGDVIAYLPEEKVCFLGDLLFNGTHPWLGSGKPEALIRILEELLRLDIEYLVPGHGKVGSREDVVLQLQYVKEILELVKAKKDDPGATYSSSELSSAFSGWNDLCFMWNINFLLGKNN